MQRFLHPRLFPMGIAARLGLTVLMALVLTQAISALVYLTDRGDGPPHHGPRIVTERVATIAKLADETEPEQRTRFVKAVDAPGLEVEWQRQVPAIRRNRTGFPFEGIRSHLREALNDPGRTILIEVHGEP